jgi:hypothetical protein
VRRNDFILIVRPAREAARSCWELGANGRIWPFRGAGASFVELRFRVKAARSNDDRRFNKDQWRRDLLILELALRSQYLLIEAGAPHSSAVTHEAHNVLDGMSRTERSQRSQVFWTLWRWTSSKKACSSCPLMSQKPKLSS